MACTVYWKSLCVSFSEREQSGKPLKKFLFWSGKQTDHLHLHLSRCFSSAEKHFYTLSVFWKVRKIINLVLCFRKIEWCYQYVWKRIICKNQTWLLWIPLHCELLTHQHFALRESYVSDECDGQIWLIFHNKLIEI